MQRLLNTIADYGALAFGVVASPALRFIARRRMMLRRFQAFSDRAGFHIRSSHYYEPTYAEEHLPEDTALERYLPGLDFNEVAQLELLSSFVFADELKSLPIEQTSPACFGYRNQMYSFGDSETYYSMIRVKKPRRIIEIGSGNSTLIALLAVAANQREDRSYDCEISCLEPYEMPWLESTGVRVIRARVETVALTMFDVLSENDILFIDSSHVIRPWGDVLRELHEIIPRLSGGVLIHVHDIFTPRDYPEKWLRQERRLWNEQYLLEAFLAYNGKFEIICAANWLKHHHFQEFSRACPMMAQNPDHEPGAFWFATKRDTKQVQRQQPAVTSLRPFSREKSNAVHQMLHMDVDTDQRIKARRLS